MKPLTIRPIPFRSSNLAVPPSPFSPRSPLQPLQAHPVQHTHPSCFPNSPSSSGSSRSRSTSSFHSSHPIATTLIPTPEHHPLVWLWQCHECYRSYPLAATRRCLNDGHIFCSGASKIKRGRKGKSKSKSKKRIGQPCASEFDYAGWKTWAVWRRAEAGARGERRARMKALRSKGKEKGSASRQDVRGEGKGGVGEGVVWKVKVVQGDERRAIRDCWNHCDYPSECRWGQAYGVPSPPPPVKPPTPTFSLPHPPPPARMVPLTSTMSIDRGRPTLSSHSPPTTFEEILRMAGRPVEVNHVREHSRTDLTADAEASDMGLQEEDAQDFWAALKRTVGKRKAHRGPGPSPLRLKPVIEVDEEDEASEAEHREDVEMKDV